MGQKSIKKILIDASKQVNIPDIRNDILGHLDRTNTQNNSVSPSKNFPRFLKLSFASCVLVSIILFSVALSLGLKSNHAEYKEIKTVDELQSVYAYQAALLTTLVNNPDSVDLNNIEVNDALSNSIGFVDFILNKDKTTSTLYQCSNQNYDYYLSTKLGNKELCKFYYNEHTIYQVENCKSTVLQGFIEIGKAKFDVFGEVVFDKYGKYVMDLMLGYQESKVCISSNEVQTNSYEYRVYNKDAVCKKVSLEFKDNQIYMNVNFQNAYFKFQIQGDNNQYSGKYHTGTSSGSLMVEIENDKYNFNVDEEKSSAERYILP